MHVHFRVCGYYDWEHADKHPGVVVTQADVRALRAKQASDGRWLIRVEREADTHHDTNIPEQSICAFMVGQALHAGNELSREEAACHFLRHSYKHHGKRSHVLQAIVHDGGANAELMQLVVKAHLDEAERAGADAATLQRARVICDEVTQRYLEPGDVAGAITAQFVRKQETP